MMRVNALHAISTRAFSQIRVGFLPEETYFFRTKWKKVEESISSAISSISSGRKWKKVDEMES